MSAVEERGRCNGAWNIMANVCIARIGSIALNERENEASLQSHDSQSSQAWRIGE